MNIDSVDDGQVQTCIVKLTILSDILITIPGECLDYILIHIDDLEIEVYN